MKSNNPVEVISQFTSFHEDDFSHLSRAERLNIRNAIILAKAGAGIKSEDIAAEMRISQRRVEQILDDAYQDALSWYQELPKKIRLALFKINTTEVFIELGKLKQIRNETTDPITKFKMGERIAKLQIAYDRMVSDGASIDRLRDQAQELENVLQLLNNKQDDSN